MRTYSYALRALTLAGLILGALVLMGTHQAPLGGWEGDAAAIAAKHAAEPTNTPTWNRQAARAHPGCEPVQDGVLYADLVVVTLSAAQVRMPLDTAWERNHNTPVGDNVWVIGGCK